MDPCQRLDIKIYNLLQQLLLEVTSDSLSMTTVSQISTQLQDGLKFKAGADELKRRHLFHVQFDSNVVPFGNTLYISHHNICLLV